mmetsp:Transcript_116318/g.324073  ORF Transcript_116318/g.324073 Transcript_116318/m.324073 type:complete len:414 (-) Transcript_116318:77-1318(-)
MGQDKRGSRRKTLTALVDDEEVRAMLTKSKSFADISVVGADKEQQIVRYDHNQLANVLVLLQPWSRGAIFRRGRIWWQIAMYIFVASVVAVLFLRFSAMPAHINPDALGKVSSYFGTFLPFLFGIYLNNIFNRWWAMRTQGVGGISNALNSMCVIMSTQLRGPSSVASKHLLLRYGLLSHELVYRAARQTDDSLQDLVASGALTSEECGILQELSGRTSKAQAVWVWMQLLWDGLFQQELIPWHVHQVVLQLIADGRTAVKSIFTHLNTQIPFAYVHLMACLVHFNLFVLALQAGMIIGKSVGMILESRNIPGKQQAADTEASTLLVSQLVYLTMVPMVYLGFLELSQEIADPFGVDYNDFPRAQFHSAMQDENESFIRAAESVPPALLSLFEPGSAPATKAEAQEPAGEDRV